MSTEEKKTSSTGSIDQDEIARVHEATSRPSSLNLYILLINIVRNFPCLDVVLNVYKWATFGGMTYGYSSNVIGSSLAQPSMQIYFKFATTSDVAGKTGGLASLFNAGGFLGFIFLAWFTDRWGRRPGFLCSGVVSVVGQALAGGSTDNWGMILFGRFLSGFGGWGLMYMSIMWQSEIAVASTRGFLAGSVGAMVAVAYALASWVGVGFFYLGSSDSWRGPLLIGILFPLVILIGLPWIPESPRYLSTQGRHAEAFEVLKRLHRSRSDPHDYMAKVDAEQIRRQTELQKTLDGSWWSIVTKASYRKRALLVMLVSTTQQCSGILVITNFGATLYASLGFTAADQQLIGAGWITLAPLVSIPMMFFVDRVGRKLLIILSPACNVVTLTIYAVLIKEYTNSTNEAGKNAAVAFIFLFMVFYLLIEVPLFVYIGELFPLHTRSKGIAIGLGTICINAIWETQSAPKALANLGWKYSFLFVGLEFACAILCWFFLIETRGVPLEEIALKFGEDSEVAVFQAQLEQAPQILTHKVEV